MKIGNFFLVHTLRIQSKGFLAVCLLCMVTEILFYNKAAEGAKTISSCHPYAEFID